MRNYRFYFAEAKSPEFILKDEALLHKMNNVLRLEPSSKEELEFFDGSGTIYEAELKSISKKEACFHVTNEYQSQREIEQSIKYYVPVIKPENFYWMIRKLTELGVTEFQAVNFSRSQKKYKESLEKQNDKINTIIQEATEQCGGAKLAKYHGIVDFKDLNLANLDAKNPDNTRVFAYEELSLEKSAKKAQELSLAADTLIMVGPEGGLTIEETQNLGVKGFIAVSLGKRLLKAETAAIALLLSLD